MEGFKKGNRSVGKRQWDCGEKVMGLWGKDSGKEREGQQ